MGEKETRRLRKFIKVTKDGRLSVPRKFMREISWMKDFVGKKDPIETTIVVAEDDRFCFTGGGWFR